MTWVVETFYYENTLTSIGDSTSKHWHFGKGSSLKRNFCFLRIIQFKSFVRRLCVPVPVVDMIGFLVLLDFLRFQAHYVVLFH